ncbi:hypothetical protein FQA39_LY09585 [Lamprigera yunnana]|nr:hypothetical protein FQA39_LY09585 [Lamprigera yunnana]
MSEKLPKYEIVILFEGYSTNTEEGTLANCTCTLLNGPNKIIVDTMTAWDGPKLENSLQEHNIDCNDIDYVISTHGHSISHKQNYYNHDFKTDEYEIDDAVKVIATPGHTLQDVSVLVQTDSSLIAVVGDLFENEHDLSDDTIWKSVGSDSEELQIKSRDKILSVADWIIPGHGSMFKNKKN